MTSQEQESESRRDELDFYIQELISEYLQTNQLEETFKLLQLETNRPQSDLSLDEDLRSIIRDRVNFNKIVERHRILNESNTVTTPHQLLIINENKIKLPIFKFPYPDEDAKLPLNIQNDSLCINTAFLKISIEGQDKNCMLFTYADKRIVVYDVDGQKILSSAKDSVVNRLILAYDNYILTCNMNGELIFHKIDELQDMKLVKLAIFKLHNRLVTSLKILELPTGEVYICSIGFDFKLSINKLDLENLKIKEIGSIKLSSNPTCIECVVQDGEPLIFVGTLESSLISTFTITRSGLKEFYKIALNDAEFNNHSFHPMSIICKENLLIISTNHIPYMRLLTVMIPKLTDDEVEQEGKILRNLVVSNINTMSVQDKYSNTIMFKREDDKGVIIVGDDGVVRGVDIKNGNVVKMADVKKRSKTLCYFESSSVELLCVCFTDKQMVFLHHRV